MSQANKTQLQAALTEMGIVPPAKATRDELEATVQAQVLTRMDAPKRKAPKRKAVPEQSMYADKSLCDAMRAHVAAHNAARADGTPKLTLKAALNDAIRAYLPVTDNVTTLDTSSNATDDAS